MRQERKSRDGSGGSGSREWRDGNGATLITPDPGGRTCEFL